MFYFFIYLFLIYFLIYFIIFLEQIYSVDIVDEEPHFVGYSAINHHHHHHYQHYYYYYYVQVLFLQFSFSSWYIITHVNEYEKGKIKFKSSIIFIHTHTICTGLKLRIKVLAQSTRLSSRRTFETTCPLLSNVGT